MGGETQTLLCNDTEILETVLTCVSKASLFQYGGNPEGVRGCASFFPQTHLPICLNYLSALGA